VQQDRRVLALRLQPLRGPLHPCAQCTHRACAEKCRTVRISKWHPPAAGPDCSVDRTRGCHRNDEHLQTARSHYRGRRAQMRDAHATNVSKRVEWSAFAHCTHRPRAPVAAASARAGAAGPMGLCRQLAATTGAAAPRCEMRTPLTCQNVSNGPHLRIAPTGRAPRWQRRPHAGRKKDRQVLSHMLQPLRGPLHPCARCAHR